jgi:hypothetical protein
MRVYLGLLLILTGCGQPTMRTFVPPEADELAAEADGVRFPFGTYHETPAGNVRVHPAVFGDGTRDAVTPRAKEFYKDGARGYLVSVDNTMGKASGAVQVSVSELAYHQFDGNAPIYEGVVSGPTVLGSFTGDCGGRLCNFFFERSPCSTTGHEDRKCVVAIDLKQT